MYHSWTKDTLFSVTHNPDIVHTPSQLEYILAFMNRHFPPSVYHQHVEKRHTALNNSFHAQNLLHGAEQLFPPVIEAGNIPIKSEKLATMAIVLTAGGEGERLRLSLQAQGASESELAHFTKATYPLPGFFEDFGTLHINLSMLASLSEKYAIDIPVIVTTGPEHSTTASIIPQIIERYQNFGLKHIRVISQDERLHLTTDDKVVFCNHNGTITPITQPDETGGPLMKLKQKSGTEPSCLEWLQSLGCRKTIIIQGTALYDPQLLHLMTSASESHDCLVVGIPRSSFPPDDPFGSIVIIRKDQNESMKIIEQNIRNEITRTLADPSGKMYLPYNTGFYVFDHELLLNNDLPDYATPPKEIGPGISRSAKIGYAATEALGFARYPVVLSVAPEMYKVLKTAKDLDLLTNRAKQYGLYEIAKKTAQNYRR